MHTIRNHQVEFQQLGLINYKKAWDYQENLLKTIVDQKISNRKNPDHQKPTANFLLFCQHPHVFTLGKSGKAENLLLNETGLQAKKASFYKINRGGDVTYHGPGQIVGYPILDLDNFFTDIHKYLRTLEEAVIMTLGAYGVASGRIDGLTGVWIDHEKQENPRKICAIGVKASRWVTMHGFAFNVSTDLNYFNYIIPCGIRDKAVTSLEKELGYTPDIDKVEQKLKDALVKLFDMRLTTSAPTL